MMRRGMGIATGLLGCLVTLLSLTLTADDSFNTPEEWRSMGRGKHTVGYDAQQQALVLSSDVGNAANAQCYPIHRVSESLAKQLRSIRFELLVPETPGEIANAAIVAARQGEHLGRFPFAVPEKGKWRSVTVDLSGNGYDPSAIRNLQFLFGANAASAKVFVRNIVLLDKAGNAIPLPPVKKKRERQTVLTPKTILQMYVEPNREAEFRFLSSGALPDTLEAELRDYHEQPLQNVRLTKIPEKEEYRFSFRPSRGFYELNIPAVNQSFGILALEKFAGSPDPFFGLEPLMIHRELPDSTVVSILELMKRYGVHSFREYHSFQGEKRNVPASPWKNRAFDLAAERGLKGIFFYGYAPGWTGSGKGDRNAPDFQPFPRDLILLDEMTSATVKRWRNALAGFQIWNEPDLRPVPCDQYLSLLAMASATLKKAAPDLPLIGAGIGSLRSPNGEYLQTPMVDYMDIFAFHHYADVETMADVILHYRNYLEQKGKGGMPIRITECGKPWSRGIVAKSSYGGASGAERPAAEEDRNSARSIVMKGFEAKAFGVSAYDPFTLKYFPENNSNFGMTDRYWTPLRAAAAYFNAIREMANFHYVGDARKRPNGVTIMRVYSNGDAMTAVPYTGSDEEMEVDFSGFPLLSARSADGRALALQNGKVRIRDGFAYLSLDRKKMPELLDTATPAALSCRMVREYRPTARKSSPVVYQFRYSGETRKNAVFYLGLPKKISFAVFNLSDEAREIKPRLTLPDGAKLIAAPDVTQIPARSAALLEWAVDWTGMDRPLAEVTLTDPVNDSMPLPLKFLEVKNARSERFETEKPERWLPNCSGKMTVSANPAENSIRFQATFDPAKAMDGYWIYPEYILRKPQESLKNAIAVSFELKANQGGGHDRYAAHCLMVTNQGEDKKFLVEKYYPAPRPEWTSYEIPFPPTWNGETIDRFRIGMNPVAPQLDYEIRNVKIHFAP